VVVATAFSAMASLLFLHGLASPGMLVGMNGLVSLSGGATLPVGGLLLALSAPPGFRGARRIPLLLAIQGLFLAAVATLGTVGLLVPAAVPDVAGAAERPRAAAPRERASRSTPSSRFARSGRSS
jgi:hypothetical protein